jgi:hypothetical protein
MLNINIICHCLKWMIQQLKCTYIYFPFLQYLPPLPTVVAIICVRAEARRPLWNETSLLLQKEACERSFCCCGSKIFRDDFYKLQLFNKIEFIKYIEYSIKMKVCFTLHFLKCFWKIICWRNVLFSWRTRTPEQAHWSVHFC